MSTTGSADPRQTDREHVQALARRWRRHGDRRARDELFEQFLPLARRLARRYVNAYEPLDDLMQVAALGLLRAVDRFDPDRGIRFPAFAIPTILGELKRYFRDTGWSVHVSRSAQEMALRVDTASRRLAARTGANPTLAELAEYLEVDVERVLDGLEAAAAHYSVSLDAPAFGAGDDAPEPLAESLGGNDDGFGLVETAMSVSAAIGRLPYLEREALRLRIGHDLKQAEIAERLDCSQMQVSRLLRRAADTLRELIDPDLSGPAEPGR